MGTDEKIAGETDLKGPQRSDAAGKHAWMFRRGPLRVATSMGPGWASKGLTLIELMISLAILGTLAGIAAPMFGTYIDKARSAKSVSDIRTVLESEIRLYEFDNDVLPVSLVDVKRGGILDPWGNTYSYLNFAVAGPSWVDKARKDEFQIPINSDYDLYSLGKDGKTTPDIVASWSQDDVIRASDGGYVGQVKDLRKKEKKAKKPKKPKKPKEPKASKGPTTPKKVK